ncbi:hypothetical protein EHQ81_03105 [Leptospira selangorensis]|uniref:Glycosyltransferase RgtA/B/C/D-like domain-containing protein n=1 Tax=Leptospira selangorensis TaxID=2484982 RepID=A0A5F2C3Z9_9LEPT|nr:hypothetical protein [Leptospira selangorensis]TGM15398.1 hypothetical protein EHQ81_03105 [Leptospira selangorensis]TGM18653.1 hypothetical protein EHQ82_16605 [Leptospira selangorensis]
MDRFDWKKIIRSNYFELTLVLFIFSYVSYQNAWLSDDSFISFRVLDHFVNGFGLRWNIAERVQAFTNPLLILVLSPFYSVYQNIVFWSFFSSFVWGLSAFYFLRRISVSKVSFWLGLCFLLSSRSFVDYTYSGLENSLNYLIEVIFFYLYFKKEEGTDSKLPGLVLLASFALVSRIDFILIFIIPLLIVFFQDWKRRRITFSLSSKIVLCSLPAILWFLFSALYYGSLLPNTYYSKTNVEDSFVQILSQGLQYYIFELKWDSIVCIFLPIVAIVRAVLRKNSNPILISLVFSLPYLMYILFVGGDFMAGRFFTYVIFLFGIALVRLENIEKKEIYILGSALILYNILLFSTPIHSIKQQVSKNPWILDKVGITDEKFWYYPGTGLSWHDRNGSILSNLANKKPFFPPTDQKVFIKYNTGVIGFFLRDQYIIDIIALGDPLLSKIQGKGRVGHKVRQLPLGYFESLESGENKIQDPKLKEYYDSLNLLTRGEIFDSRRLNLFWKFQFGSLRRYNEPYLIDEVREKKIWSEGNREKMQ